MRKRIQLQKNINFPKHLTRRRENQFFFLAKLIKSSNLRFFSKQSYLLMNTPVQQILRRRDICGFFFADRVRWRGISRCHLLLRCDKRQRQIQTEGSQHLDHRCIQTFQTEGDKFEIKSQLINNRFIFVNCLNYRYAFRCSILKELLNYIIQC